MQSGKVILCGIGFYRVHSQMGQSVLVHYGWIGALGSWWRWDFLSFKCWRKSTRWNINSCGWLLHCRTWFLHYKSSSPYRMLVHLRTGDVWMAPLLSGYPDLPRIVIYPSYGLRIETSIPSSTFSMSMKDYADSLWRNTEGWQVRLPVPLANNAWSVLHCFMDVKE